MANTTRDGASSRVLTAPFLLAVAMLCAAAVLTGPGARWAGVKQDKIALPLATPLGSLNEASLAPYEVLARHHLEPVVVEALGTQHYISWTLADASLPSNDPLRLASLLVTYYSGGHSLVPHTPDVCFLGSGYSAAQAHENMEVDVATLEPADRSVPVRVCTFVKTAVFDRQKLSVVYTFQSNGVFTASRTGVRLLTSDPRASHAYFSKVEVTFPHANREQNVAGARKLFERVLPVLTRDHWPDFAAAQAASQPD